MVCRWTPSTDYEIALPAPDLPKLATSNSARRRLALLSCLAAACLAACGSPEPVPDERYRETDQFIELIGASLSSRSSLREIADIDHSRLGASAGSPMPPARALIFSDPQLESLLIEQAPLIALDLPLRVLAFEEAESQSNKVIYNRFDYLVSRYQLDSETASELGVRYDQLFSDVTVEIPAGAVASFSSDEMKPDGIITIPSPYDFAETLQRVNDAIEDQDDTLMFGLVDFQANAREVGRAIRPSTMILFGAPGPGGKAMSSSPTLGLDGFCQKFLIWEDGAGQIKLSFNDLLALARRQEAKVALALRVVNFRLNSVFSDALSEE